MGRKILLSAERGCPGALAALRNHQGILAPVVECDFIPLDQLVLPYGARLKSERNLCWRAARRSKIVSIKKIIPYGENIIFGSFAPIYETIIERLNKKGIRPSFMWCSTLGQLELTPGEQRTFMRIIELLRGGKIKYLLLHRRLYNSLGYFIKETTFLPHSIDLTPYQNVVKKDLPDTNIDLFCRVRHGKNILNQVLAFTMTEVRGHLHVNFDVNQFSGIIETMTSKIVKHPWLTLEDYYQLIAAMDLSLQVTIGESFNYAVCERMALMVPVLTTPDIYLISEDTFLAKHLCISAPDTPIEIAKGIKKIVNDTRLKREVAERCRERIEQVARDNNKIVVDQITRLFG
jgi:hypothetical protein